MGLISTPDIGLIEFARQFRYGIGGAESNVAIGAARLGAPVTGSGRLGCDATGDMIERRLRAEGVRVHAVRDGGFTGLMLRHHRAAGHASVDYHRAGSAASRLCAADIPDDLLAGAAILHVTGITAALSDSARRAVFSAAGRARELGVTVSLDVNYRAKLWEPAAAAPVLRALAERADILMAGPGEARLLLGDPDTAAERRMLERLAALGPHEVVVKDGARGCTALIGGAHFRLPALRVPVVAPAVTGDAFTAGYLADHLAGQPPETRLRTAIAAGAFAVAVPGDCEGLPRRHELTALGTDPEDAIR
ncbi:MAG: sugar kinase [Acidobacteria bacterium]|nr:sugar kinase [Acidobacteriota bacterium]